MQARSISLASPQGRGSRVWAGFGAADVGRGCERPILREGVSNSRSCVRTVPRQPRYGKTPLCEFCLKASIIFERDGLAMGLLREKINHVKQKGEWGSRLPKTCKYKPGHKAANPRNNPQQSSQTSPRHGPAHCRHHLSLRRLHPHSTFVSPSLTPGKLRISAFRNRIGRPTTS
jgi:hypothetical protein